MRDEALRKDETRKFHLPYKGSYVVKKVIPPVNYLTENREGKTCTVHFKRLKRSYGNFDRLTDNPISEGVSEKEGKISRSTDPINNRHQFRGCCSPEPELRSTYQLQRSISDLTH